ncbi:MAG: hypothetical protein J6A59_09100 [Lachnospiraceae bacterium]|nr:hypothetical protein [Lachnospiraceae bacterium]
MTINIGELRETLELNANSLKNNRMLTNEILVDDIMVALGYNKKRDTSVKRLYNGPIDWEVITATGNRLAVKVFAPGDGIVEEELKETITTCTDKRFSLLMIINGDELILYRFNKESREYVKVWIQSLNNEFNDTSMNILNAISKDGYDISYIDSQIKTSKLTLDEFRLKIFENSETVANAIVEVVSGLNASDSSEYANYLTILLDDAVIEGAEATALDNENIKIELESAYATIEALKEALKEAQHSSNSEVESFGNTSDEIDSYRTQIQELTIKLSTATERVDELEKELAAAKDEIDNMSGADRRRAQELLGVIEDNPELDRHYVGVINTELIQFDELHTFIGRSLQKLYEIKSFEASQFIFNGDIFRLVQPAERNDLIMNNKAYDIDIDGQHEDDVLNKIRIVFSHFDDVIFECKKIGTFKDGLEDEINTDEEYIEDTENTEVDALEYDDNTEEEYTYNDTDGAVTEEIEYQDVEISDEYSSTEEIAESDIFAADEDELITEESDEYTGEENIFTDEEDIFADGEIEEPFGNVDNIENSNIFADEEVPSIESQFDAVGIEDESLFDEDITTADGAISLVKEESELTEEYNTDEFSDGFELDENSEDTWEVDSDLEMEMNDNTEQFEAQQSLLVVQMLQLDQLIWSDEKITFNTIKYLGDNYVTFNINAAMTEMSCEQLLCKCIDAVLAIEAQKGNAGAIALLKHKDFSLVNNFLKLYTEEYAEYPRINGTKYAIVGIESVQQVASVLYDICESMQIDMSEIFLYFDTYTNSDYIVTNYGYSEDAVQLRDYNEFEQPEDIKTAVAIIKGDIFNNIVVTKNSLKAHEDILVRPTVVKTKYLTRILDSYEAVVEVIEQMIVEASKVNKVNLKAIGNVVGENRRLISENADEVGDNIMIEATDVPMYVAKVADWQILHSLIKIHTTLFNNTAIALKTNVSVNAINFYGKQFETSEPSFSLAVKSFVDYVALSVKEQ